MKKNNGSMRVSKLCTSKMKVIRLFQVLRRVPAPRLQGHDPQWQHRPPGHGLLRRRHHLLRLPQHPEVPWDAAGKFLAGTWKLVNYLNLQVHFQFPNIFRIWLFNKASAHIFCDALKFSLLQVTEQIQNTETGEIRNVTTYVMSELRMNQYYML